MATFEFTAEAGKPISGSLPDMLRSLHGPPLAAVPRTAYQQYRIVPNQKVFRIQGKTSDSPWRFAEDRGTDFRHELKIYETASLDEARAELAVLLAIIADNTWVPVDGGE